MRPRRRVGREKFVAVVEVKQIEIVVKKSDAARASSSGFCQTMLLSGGKRLLAAPWHRRGGT